MLWRCRVAKLAAHLPTVNKSGVFFAMAATTTERAETGREKRNANREPDRSGQLPRVRPVIGWTGRLPVLAECATLT